MEESKLKEKIIEYLGEKVADFFLDEPIEIAQYKIKQESNRKKILKFRDYLDNKILEKYGNEIFYDDLCMALLENDAFTKLLQRYIDRSLNDLKTDHEIIAEIMAGMKIKVYNEAMVKEAIIYITQQAYSYLNQLSELENIKLKNIVLNTRDQIFQRIDITRKDIDKLATSQNDIEGTLQTIIKNQDIILNNQISVESSGKITAKDISKLECDSYTIKLSANDKKDYFKIIADVEINPKDFSFENFNEYIAYLRFAGKEVNFNVCRFIVYSSDGTILQEYENSEYNGMKMSLPVVYTKEVEASKIEIKSMKVCITPQFEFKEFQIETYEGEILIPNRTYKMEREINGNILNVHLIDQSKNRLITKLLISIVMDQSFVAKTHITIAQRDEKSVISNLEFSRLLKKMSESNSIIAKDINTEKDILMSDSICCDDRRMLENIDIKIRFYEQLLRMERLFNIKFQVPDDIETSEIDNVKQIAKVLSGGVVRTNECEITIHPDEFAIEDGFSIDDLIGVNKFVMTCHYKKITILDVEIPVVDYFKSILYIDNVCANEDKSITLHCTKGYIYNEQLATLPENQIISNFAHDYLKITS